MQEDEEVVAVEQEEPPFYIKHLILRIPYYILVGIYYFTFRYVLLLLARIYGIIRRRVLHFRVKSLGEKMGAAFSEDRYEDAKNLCLQIIEIIPPVWRHLFPNYRFAILSLGSIYRFLGDLKNAKKYLLEADAILDEGDFNRIYLYIYEGDFHTDKGDLKTAESSYLAAYEWLKDYKEDEYYKTLCFNMHSLYLEMGQIKKAEKFLKESK